MPAICNVSCASKTPNLKVVGIYPNIEGSPLVCLIPSKHSWPNIGTRRRKTPPLWSFQTVFDLITTSILWSWHMIDLWITAAIKVSTPNQYAGIVVLRHYLTCNRPKTTVSTEDSLPCKSDFISVIPDHLTNVSKAYSRNTLSQFPAVNVQRAGRGRLFVGFSV